MTPRIINVIEVINNSVSSVESFIIPDELQEKERVAAAEKLFAQKAKENGVGENSIEDCIENGYFAQGDYLLSLTWSDLK